MRPYCTEVRKQHCFQFEITIFHISLSLSSECDIYLIKENILSLVTCTQFYYDLSLLTIYYIIFITYSPSLANSNMKFNHLITTQRFKEYSGWKKIQYTEQISDQNHTTPQISEI